MLGNSEGSRRQGQQRMRQLDGMTKSMDISFSKLLEFAQVHVLWTGGIIQLSHPLSSPSTPPALNLSQHQDLFQWGGSSHLVAKVLELQLQHQSFQWIFRVHFPLGMTGLISLQLNGLSRVFSSTVVQKHEFFGALRFFTGQLSHSYLTTGKTIVLTIWAFLGKVMSLLFTTEVLN